MSKEELEARAAGLLYCKECDEMVTWQKGSIGCIDWFFILVAACAFLIPGIILYLILASIAKKEKVCIKCKTEVK